MTVGKWECTDSTLKELKICK